MSRKPTVEGAAEPAQPTRDTLQDACPDRIERLIEALARCAAKQRLREGRENVRRRT